MPEQVFLRGQRLDDGHPVSSWQDHQGAFEEIVADPEEGTLGSDHLDPIGEAAAEARGSPVRSTSW